MKYKITLGDVNIIRHGKRAAARRLFFFCRRPADEKLYFDG